MEKEPPHPVETPRTDALLLEINEGRVHKENGPVADLAKELERELSKSLAEKLRRQLRKFDDIEYITCPRCQEELGDCEPDGCRDPECPLIE